MTNIQRYAASFLSDDSLLEPGDIFRKLDGTLWYVDTNGDQQSLTSGSGGSQNLGQVLTVGNDGSGLQAKNLAEGTDPADAATVSQLGGGGLPTGWTEDDSDPANVTTNGAADGSTGGLIAGNGTTDFSAADATGFNTTVGGNKVFGAAAGGVQALATDTCFTAANDNGATVALDAGGLDIANAGDVDGATLGPTFDYVTVQAAPPTVYLTPLVQDTTAVTGGVYAWDGSAYQKISSV